MFFRASNLLSQRLSSNRNILVPRIQIHHRNNKNLFFHPNQILRRSFVLIKRPWIDRTHTRHQYSATKSFTNVVVVPKRNIIKGTIPEGGHNIAVNHYAELDRQFTSKEILMYGQLIGDLNPIHVVQEFKIDLRAEENWKNNHHPLLKIDSESNDCVKSVPVVHGQLISSLASSIFGTLVPGCIYRSQNLVYRKPVYADDLIRTRVTVRRIIRTRGKEGNGSLIICKMEVYNLGEDTSSLIKDREDYSTEDNVCVDGEITVWLPSN